MSIEAIKVICPHCRGNAQQVSASKIQPNNPLTLQRIWWCERCQVYAPMDRDHKPMGALADREVWSLREQVKNRLLDTRTDIITLGTKLGLAPWSCRLGNFTLDMCEEALEEMEGTPRAVRVPEEEILNQQIAELLA